jgi:hypothetical protein
MKMLKFTPLFIALLSSSSYATSFVQERVNAELKSPTPFSSSELEKAQSVQFIFVDGIFGDVFKSNFHPAVDELTHDWNVTDSVVITPDTATPMSDNADLLYTEISKIRAASPHSEAILTAHSKGATETLLMVLRHPDVITRLGIQTINLVSGPHGGTNVVEYFNHCSPLDFICGALNHLLPSLVGFKPENIIPLEMTAFNALSASVQQETQSHLYYVETLMADDDLSSPLLVPHFYLNASESDQNDGLIPTANEVFIPQGSNQPFGNDLGIMKGDHNSLLSKAITPDNKVYRKAFFQVLVRNTLLK